MHLGLSGSRLGLHSEAEGRAVFADVMLIGPDRVVVTYQLAPADTFCENKSLYVQQLDRQLDEQGDARMVIDVSNDSTIFGPTQDRPGDLGDHKFTFMAGTIYMLTTVPGEPEARLIRFDSDFNAIDDLGDDEELGRVGDEGAEDRLLDMGFGNDGTHLYAQFFNQPANSQPDDWGAQLYKVDPSSFEVVGEGVVQPEQGNFITGTSIVSVPAGQMGVTEATLQSFSSNVDYGSSTLSGIHTFATTAGDLELISGSTRTIAEDDLDLYFPTGADWNEKHQIWVVGYTREIAAGLHGSVVMGANACAGTEKPPGEDYRELGPSFVSIYDAQWNPIDTIALNDGDPAFRVMLETQDDDLYVVYDEMDKYAWKTSSVAKVEHYAISVSAE